MCIFATVRAPQHPVKLFRAYDTDESGTVSADEFSAMLPRLGIQIPAAKAIRLFRQLDTDRSGSLSLDEFRAAILVLRPTAGGTASAAHRLDVSPLLGPRDAFVLFDRDNSGAIDEDEFVWVLEFMGYDVKLEDEALVESMFHKYDVDKSGKIEYPEFRAAWLDLCDVRQELRGRGYTAFEDWTPRWRLSESLDQLLRETEARDAQALAFATRWVAWQATLKQRRLLLQAARSEAEKWLVNALDMAGQVYFFGRSGSHHQHLLAPTVTSGPGLHALWMDRTDPLAGGTIRREDTAHEKGEARLLRRTRTAGATAASLAPDDIARMHSRKADPTLPQRQQLAGEQRSAVAAPASSFAFRPAGRPKRTDIRAQAASAPVGGSPARWLRRNRAEAAGTQEPPPEGNRRPRPDSSSTESSPDITPDEVLNGEPVRHAHLRSATAASGANPFFGVAVSSATFALWGQGMTTCCLGGAAAVTTDGLGRLFAWTEAAVAGPRHGAEASAPEASELVLTALGARTSAPVSAAARRELETGVWSASATAPPFVLRTAMSSQHGREPREQAAHAGRPLGRHGRRPPARPSSSMADAGPSRPPAGFGNAAPHHPQATVLVPNTPKLATSQVSAGRPESLLEAQRRAQLSHVRLALQRLGHEVPELPPPGKTAAEAWNGLEAGIVPSIDKRRLYALLEWRGIDSSAGSALDAIELLGRIIDTEQKCMGSEESARVAEVEVQLGRLEEDRRLEDAAALRKVLASLWARIKPLMTRAHSAAKAELRRQSELANAEAEASYARRRLIDEAASRDARACFSMDGTILALDGASVFASSTEASPCLRPPHWTAGGKVDSLAVGQAHLLVVHHGGLFSAGSGAAGRLGHGRTLSTSRVTGGGQLRLPASGTTDSAKLARVAATATRTITAVDAGFSHSAAVASDGGLWVWGSASMGKLGVGPLPTGVEQVAVRPVLISPSISSRVVQVSCGMAHTACTTEDGALYAWGSSANGRLGLDADPLPKSVTSPVLITNLLERDIRVSMVACGASHTLVSTRVLGHGADATGGAVLVAGNPSACGSTSNRFEPNPGEIGYKPVCKVAAGRHHSAAVTAQGELYTWGTDIHGNLGHPLHQLETRVVMQPKLVACLFSAPQNLCRVLEVAASQSSTFNRAQAGRAVNGDTSGCGLASVTHTHTEACPWLQVDLGRECNLNEIRVWNRSDVPVDPGQPRGLYRDRICPAWIMVSSSPFTEAAGLSGLEAAMRNATAKTRLVTARRMMAWTLPWQTSGRYVRVQSCKTAALHIAELEVLGTTSRPARVNLVVDVSLDQGTLVTLGASEPEALRWAYTNALCRDAGAEKILRELPPYWPAYDELKDKRIDPHASLAACLDARGDEIADLHTPSITQLWIELMAEEPPVGNDKT